jgi:hypothetical protein
VPERRTTVEGLKDVGLGCVRGPARITPKEIGLSPAVSEDRVSEDRVCGGVALPPQVVRRGRWYG